MLIKVRVSFASFGILIYGLSKDMESPMHWKNIFIIFLKRREYAMPPHRATRGVPGFGPEVKGARGKLRPGSLLAFPRERRCRAEQTVQDWLV